MIFDLHDALQQEPNHHGYRHWKIGEVEITAYGANQALKLALGAGAEVTYRGQREMVTIDVLDGNVNVRVDENTSDEEAFDLAHDSDKPTIFNLRTPFHLRAKQKSLVMVLVRPHDGTSG